jgi:hypothetical protein
LSGLRTRRVPKTDGTFYSEYAVSTVASTTQATKDIWTQNWRKYQSKSGLEITYSKILSASSTGTYSRTISVEPNSVVFYELIPASPVPSITSPM